MLYDDFFYNFASEYINTTGMIQSLFIGGIGLPEILVIALVVLLLFGGKKIPELMKGLGKGVRSFKEGLKDDTEADGEDGKEKN